MKPSIEFYESQIMSNSSFNQCHQDAIYLYTRF